MKIAFIGQKGIPFTFGGVENHVESLATRLVKEGQEVTVYCRQWYTQTTPSNYQGVSLRYTKSLHSKNLDAITGSFTATLDAMRRGFDIIHYQGVGPALLSWIPRIFAPQIKVVVTFHCQDRLHGKWGLLARLMLALGERAACYFPHETIVVSQTLKDYVAKKYHCQAIYIPNGVTLPENFSPTDILNRLGLQKKNYILAVTRLISHKSVHNLIEAFNALKQDNAQSLTQGLKLVIVGEGFYTDKYVQQLKQLAQDNPEVIFAGWQGGVDLQTLYQEAKLFVHPSVSEGLPLVVLEAMSYGLPVVVSNIPEHQELISDKRFSFAVGQSADLQRVLFWCLQNPEILQATGQANFRLVKQDYNWDQSARQLNEVYQKLKLTADPITIRPSVKKVGFKVY